MIEDMIMNNYSDELPYNIRYAIYECNMYFHEIKFILDNIKKRNIHTKNKLKKMTTIWEDPYM